MNGRACALKRTLGTGLYCWGATIDVDEPELFLPFAVDLRGLTGTTKKLTLGNFHGCALQDGGVKCWTREGPSTLLGGGTNFSFVPGMGPGSGVSEISAGPSHTCAVQNGGLRCWGEDVWFNKPGCVTREVSGGYEIDTKTISFPAQAGSFDFSFDAYGIPDKFRVEDTFGHVYAQSNGFISEEFSATIQKPGGVTEIKVTVEGSEDGTAWEYSLSCLREGSDETTLPSTFVPGFGANSGVTKVSSGDDNVCVIQNGGVKCLGMDPRFGDGISYVPGLSSGSGVYDIAAPRSRWNPLACAVQNSGLKCWGFDEEDESIGSTTSYVKGLEANTAVASVSIGSEYICAVQQGGLRCSTLDDPLTFNVSFPGFGPNSGVTQVVTYEENICAVRAAGVHCLGPGEAGQLGSGKLEDSEAPVQVVEILHGKPCYASAYDAQEEKICSSMSATDFLIRQLKDPTTAMRCAIDDPWKSVDITGLVGSGYPGPISKDKLVCLAERQRHPQTLIWAKTGAPPYIPWEAYRGMLKNNDCSSITLSLHSHSSSETFSDLIATAIKTNTELGVDVPLSISQDGCNGTSGIANDLFIVFDKPAGINPLIREATLWSQLYNSTITVTGNQFMSEFNSDKHEIHSSKQSPLRIFFKEGKITSLQVLWPCPSAIETFQTSQSYPTALCYINRTPEKNNSSDGTSSTDIYRLDCAEFKKEPNSYPSCTIDANFELHRLLLKRNKLGDYFLPYPLK